MTRLLTGFVWDGASGGIDAYLMAFARVAAQEGVRVDFLTNERSGGTCGGNGLHGSRSL